jgi:hypothetical protein
MVYFVEKWEEIMHGQHIYTEKYLFKGLGRLL